MRAPCRQRPTRNGSSDTTFDILLGLTLLGASALTALAVLRPGRRQKPSDEPSAQAREDEERRAGDG